MTKTPTTRGKFFYGYYNTRCKVSSRGSKIFIQVPSNGSSNKIQDIGTLNIPLAQTIRRNIEELEGQVAPPQALQQRANTQRDRTDKETLPVLSGQNDALEQALRKGLQTVLSNALQNNKETGIRNFRRQA